MHLEEFAEGASIIHYLDPRIKIVSAGLFSAVVGVSDRPLVLWASLVVAIGLAIVARLPVRRLLARLALVNTFILFLWIFLPVTHPGRTVATLGSLAVTREGLEYALAITVKSNAIILGMLALLGTSTFFALVHALRHLYVPDKLVNLFFFTFHYFQVIHKEYLRLRAAMKIRGFMPGTNLHTYRSIAYLLGMLLVRSFDRSDRVYRAMLCRGYQGHFWLLDHFHLHDHDLIFLTVMMLITLLLAVGQWTNLIL